MIIYHQKVIFPHKSVPYSPEKIIQPHLFNIFTLKHDFCTFVEKMSRVAFTHFYGPNRSGCLDWGAGGRPNLGNACILGTSGPATPSLGGEEKDGTEEEGIFVVD